MRFTFALAALLQLVSPSTSTVVLNDDSTLVQPLYELVQRQMPLHKDSFLFKLTEAEAGTLDAYTVTDLRTSPFSQAPYISIECNTVSACSTGLHLYLTTFGRVDIDWTNSTLSKLPFPPPRVDSPITATAIVQFRYALNTVTFGYAMPFWGWAKWEHFLDWCSLQGVNLLLSWVGEELVMTEVLEELGFSQAEIDSFITCPPFSAWQHLGNIQGDFAGACPQSIIEDQAELQKLILKRTTDLGMFPVLPVHNGFVPSTFIQHFPNASVTNAPAWEGFSPQYTEDTFLEPTDALSASIQEMYMNKYQEIYGAYGANETHFYAQDYFNELLPPYNTTAYLRNVSAYSIANLRRVDEEATVVLQSWLFFSASTFWTYDLVEAYLSGFPTSDCKSGNMSLLILDLYSESNALYDEFSQYFGHCYSWDFLNDYGGNDGLEANFLNITTGPLTALNQPNSTMVSMGIAPEGLIPENEIAYDLVFQQAWSETPLNIDEFVSGFYAARYNIYGDLPTSLLDAVYLLAATVWNNTLTSSLAVVKPIVGLSPALTGLANVSGHHTTIVFYDTKTSLVPAIENYLVTAERYPQLISQNEFLFDLVSLMRQLLDNIFLQKYNSLVAAYTSNSTTIQELEVIGSEMLDILEDLDTLLYTDKNYLLSEWIKDAISWASPSGVAMNLNMTIPEDVMPGLDTNETLAAYMEYSARNIITLWGDKGEIYNYAARDWHGLMKFYWFRWEFWLKYLYETLENGGYDTYNSTYVTEVNLELGVQFCTQRWGTSLGDTWDTYGDPYDVSKTLADKYMSMAN